MQVKRKHTPFPQHVLRRWVVEASDWVPFLSINASLKKPDNDYLELDHFISIISEVTTWILRSNLASTLQEFIWAVNCSSHLIWKRKNPKCVSRASHMSYLVRANQPCPPPLLVSSTRWSVKLSCSSFQKFLSQVTITNSELQLKKKLSPTCTTDSSSSTSFSESSSGANLHSEELDVILELKT